MAKSNINRQDENVILLQAGNSSYLPQKVTHLTSSAPQQCDV